MSQIKFGQTSQFTLLLYIKLQVWTSFSKVKISAVKKTPRGISQLLLLASIPFTLSGAC